MGWRRFGAIIFVVLLAGSWAQAQFARQRHFGGFPDGLWGVGVLLGDPVSAQARYFTSWKTAWSLSSGYGLTNHVWQNSADFLLYGYSAQDKVLDQSFWNSLIFYGGPGILTGVGLAGSDPNDNLQLGLRLVGGVEYIFTGSPFSFRVEASPEFYLKGKSSFGVALGIGFTYYFFDKAVDISHRRTKYGTYSHQTSDDGYDYNGDNNNNNNSPGTDEFGEPIQRRTVQRRRAPNRNAQPPENQNKQSQSTDEFQ